jgi:hypothetical protein
MFSVSSSETVSTVGQNKRNVLHDEFCKDMYIYIYIYIYI